MRVRGQCCKHVCLSTRDLEGPVSMPLGSFSILDSHRLLVIHSQVQFSATAPATMHFISRYNHSIDHIVCNTSYAHICKPHTHTHARTHTTHRDTDTYTQTHTQTHIHSINITVVAGVSETFI